MQDTSGRVLATTTLVTGRVFTVTREEVELPNGRRTALDVVRHPGAAAMVPVVLGGAGLEVVLLRQYRPVVGRTILEVPAGTLEPGEDPSAGAARELEEETGLVAGRLTLLTNLWPAPGYTDERIAVYLAEELRPGRQQLDADELLVTARLPLTEAVARVHSGEIADAKSAVGLLLAAARLGVG
jgi:ADP-ribose pyrophosphatase